MLSFRDVRKDYQNKSVVIITVLERIAMNTVLRIFAVSVATMSLLACGGGGGDAGGAAAATSTSTFSIANANIDNIKATRNLNWTLSGVVSGVAVGGSGTYVDSGLAASTFGGGAAQLKTIRFNGNITAQGQSSPYSQIENVYYDAAFLQIGSVGAGGTLYTTVNLSALPTAAKIGDSGTLATVTGYSNPAKTSQTGTSTVTWALSADTATTAILKVTTTSNNAASPSTSVETLRITPAGVTTKVSIESNVGGQVLKFSF
jgi:hypothetical protein